MVIQTKIDDGISVKTRTYRGLVRGFDFDRFIKGFNAQRQFCRSGVMIELRGAKRITLARFGADNAKV